MNDYSDFTSDILKRNTKKNIKVTNSLGSKEAWRWLKKNKWLDLELPITEGEYGRIIKEVNLYLAERLLQGHDITLPHRMGKIEIRKTSRGASIDLGKLKVTYPVDWESTLKLWYDDEEAKRDKLVVRFSNKEIFTVCYNKRKAVYNNKRFFLFSPTRTLKRKLKEKANNKEIDGFYFFKR